MVGMRVKCSPLSLLPPAGEGAGPLYQLQHLGAGQHSGTDPLDRAQGSPPWEWEHGGPDPTPHLPYGSVGWGERTPQSTSETGGKAGPEVIGERPCPSPAVTLRRARPVPHQPQYLEEWPLYHT